jgi:hypothetical protein
VLDGADEEVAAIIATSRNAELVTYATRINGKLATYELTKYLSPPFWSGMSVTDWDEKVTLLLQSSIVYFLSQVSR